jgi:radical SAM superfamily enzyme YgiQ (UPF0313 family)
MRALLIHPEYPETFWSFKHALRFVGKEAALPPLGLLTVAALLPREWDKRLVDLNVDPLTDQDLDWADCAFVGGMTLQRDSARHIVSRCKDAGLRVVAGGPLFTSEHEEFEEVDHLVLNEAEVTLPRFLMDLKDGRARRLYATPELADMRRSPPPLWELADFRRYASMSIQFSRGCPYDCEFCNVTALFGHRPRTKTPGQILFELDRLYQLGWRKHVFFVDDNLIGHRKSIKTELLPSLIEWQRGRNIPFYTQASLNMADDDELLDLMVEAGFDTVFVGIETPDDVSLTECNKKHNTNRDLVGDVRHIQRAGMQVQGGFIVGFDNDTPSIFQRQIDFIQNSGIVTAMVGLLQAPPGTRLYERLKHDGRLSGRMSGDNADGMTNILPVMELETLREGYRKILDHIYSPGPYYRRVRTFLRHYQPPKVKAPLHREDLLAFLRSMYHLGIRGRERFHYWRLLAWTLCRRPRLFPLAVTLAIYGHHFARVSQL